MMEQELAARPDAGADYVAMAPLALAFERIMECRILAGQSFARPVLDIGCGEGLFAKMLFAGKVDTGIDPNARELARARELGAYDELIQCYGDAIPKPDASYRTVLSNSVVEHIPDLLPVLAEARRLLVPGGRLYLTVPSDRFHQFTLVNQFLALLGMAGLQKRFEIFFNRFWAHYHYHDSARWREIAVAAGFEVVEVREYGPKSVCLMNDALVPFSAPELVTKKLLNRWTLFPRLRGAILAPAAWLAGFVLRGAERCDRGGLVFLSLRKAG